MLLCFFYSHRPLLMNFTFYYTFQLVYNYYAFLLSFSRLCYELSEVLSEVLGMARWYEKYGILGLCEKIVQGMFDMLLLFKLMKIR